MITLNNTNSSQLEQVGKQRLLTETQAAELLGLTVGTLQVWRCTKRYNLAYIKVGRLVRYRHSDLLAFLEARTHNKLEG